MGQMSQPRRKPSRKATAAPSALSERILEEIRLAGREAVQAHKRAGQPVAIWRDGRVVWLQPDEIPTE